MQGSLDLVASTRNVRRRAAGCAVTSTAACAAPGTPDAARHRDVQRAVVARRDRGDVRGPDDPAAEPVVSAGAGVDGADRVPEKDPHSAEGQTMHRAGLRMSFGVEL
jgi:hypothetical protein